MRTRVDDNITYDRPVNARSGKVPVLTVPKHCSTVDEDFILPWDYPLGRFRSITDQVVPNFRARSAKGEIFNNPVSITSWERTLSLSTRSYYVPWKPSEPPGNKVCTYYYQQTSSGDLAALNAAGSPVSHTPSQRGSVGSLVEQAGTTALAGVESPEFQGAVFVAELRETIGFLRNPIGGLNKFLKAAQKAKRKKRSLNDKTVMSFVSDQWLSYRYAVRPLVHDAESAGRAIAKTVLNHRPERNTSRGTAADTEVLHLDGDYNGSYSYEKETTNSWTVRAGILYQFERSPDTFGTAFPQLGVAAWEAIPFSFVADWFFNIGSFVEAITPVAGVKRLASWTTIIEESETKRRSYYKNGGTHPYGMPRIITDDGSCDEKLSSRTYRRVPGIRIGLVSKLRPLSGDVGGKRILDLLALTSQLLRSK